MEGILAGIKTHGLDINLLSKIICSAKTTWLGNGRDVLKKAHDLLSDSNGCRDLDADGSGDFKKYLIDYWFKQESIIRIRQISARINSMRESKTKTLFQCVLSATARDSSLTYRSD